MTVLVIVLLVCAVLCALLATPDKFESQWNLMALSLAFGWAAFLVQAIDSVS